MDKHCPNLAVSNYRSSAATLPKKRQSSSNTCNYNQLQSHKQQQQHMQQYYSSSSAGQHLQSTSSYNQHQNSSLSNGQAVNKTHRSSKDSLGSIAKEHHSSTAAAMIENQIHSGGNLSRPPPSVRNQQLKLGATGGSRKNNTFQKTISGLTQQQKLLHQNLKATVRSPRTILQQNNFSAQQTSKRGKDLSSTYGGGGGATLTSHEQISAKNMLSPKRTAPQQSIPNAKQLLKKVAANNQRSKSKSSSSGKHTAQGSKLTKATSQKALRGTQKTKNALMTGKSTSQFKKPTPSKQRCETNGSEIYPTMETPTTIQPPISSTTMINASRRKFISTPRNGQGVVQSNHNNVMLAAQTLLPHQKSSNIMQRNLSNKLLSPVATTSRTKNQPMNYISPPNLGDNGNDMTGRPKSHVKTFCLPKGNATMSSEQLLSMSQSQKQTVTSKTIAGLPPSQYKTHQYTHSLQSAQQVSAMPLQYLGAQQQQQSSTTGGAGAVGLQSNPSLGSLLIKAPHQQQQQHSSKTNPIAASSTSNHHQVGGGGSSSTSLTRHHHKTASQQQSTADKLLNSKMMMQQQQQHPHYHLGERPKTTMLVQLQQQQSSSHQHSALPTQTNASSVAAKPFHRQHQSSAMSTHHRILSPASSQQQLLTNSSSENLNARTALVGYKGGTGHPNQNQTTVVHHGNGSRLGIQHQRSSGDFSLQTYRHTSQSSQGFISNVTKSNNIFINSGELTSQQMQAATHRMLQKDLSKKALAHERYSTTTLKTYKSGKTTAKHFSGCKGPARPTSSAAADTQITQSNQQAEANIVLHQHQKQQQKLNSCRKGSQINSQTNRRQQTAFSEFEDDGISSRSAKTHVIDEVLHQQKTEAYRDLQRTQHGGGSNIQSQYGMIVETSSMGQIIEQEDELQELSIDKEEIAHELETQGNEKAYPSHSSIILQQNSKNATVMSQSASAVALALGSKQPKQPQQVQILDHETPKESAASMNLRTMTNRAKTAINLNDLRQMKAENQAVGAGGTAFSIRKQSNDTVLQATQSGKDLLLPRKSQLAMLLVNKPGKSNTKSKGDNNGGSQLLERNSANQIMPVDGGKGNLSNDFNKNKSIMMHQGLISESLVNSYLTGSGSMAGQSHKWMCSSKSAKNMMTSCSLGPKSELKQTEQANAENTIKILYNSNQVELTGGAHRSNVVSNASNDGHQQRRQVVSSDRKSDRPLVHEQQVLQRDEREQLQILHQLVGQQGLNTAGVPLATSGHGEQPGKRKSSSVMMPFGPKQSKTVDVAVSKPGLLPTDSSLIKPIQESFKSTQVDYTESMNENQITRLTVDQTRDMLIQACNTGDLQTVRRLATIDKAAVNVAELVNKSSPSSTEGNSPLHYACISGHVEIAELLIRKMSSNVDQTNSSGETPLHLACSYGHKGVIERLLLARASTNIKDTLNGNTPLHVLAQASHQRNQDATPIQTGSSDTIRQTMGSSNNPAECLITEDLVANGSQTNPQLSLIELILPFAEESKSIINKHGLMPWQLVQCETIATLLKPAFQITMAMPKPNPAPEKDLNLQGRASQIQGQGNQDGRSSVMTRNHSMANNLNINEPLVHNAAANSIEVKQVTEDEIAGIFTFYQASKADEAQNLYADKQFTFQATQPSATMEQAVGLNGPSDIPLYSNQSLPYNQTNSVAAAPAGHLNYMTGCTMGPESRTSEIYQTLSSKESLADAKNHSKKRQHSSDYQMQQRSYRFNQTNEEEEEKKNIKNFLDDEFQQIDSQQEQRDDRGQYSSSKINVSKERQAIKRHRTDQNLKNKDRQISSQFLYQMQESQNKQNYATEEAKQSQRQYKRESQYQSEKHRLDDRGDTPALQRDSRQESQMSNAVAHAQYATTKNKTNYQPSKTLFPQRQQLSTTFDKHGASSKLSSAQQQYSPQKKIVLKATSKHSKTGINNQTIDSNKSTNAQNTSKVKTATSGQIMKQMAKVRTVQNLRPQSSTQQIQQSKSTARLKLAEIVQPFDVSNGIIPGTKQQTTTPTHQKAGRNSNQLATTSKTSVPQTVQKSQTSKLSTMMRTANSALDLKQKVDKQAGLLMQRSSSRQILDVRSQMRIGPDQFVAHQLLGTGSFGEVFLVERKLDKKLLAMKVLSKRKIKRDNLKKYAITERNVMCSMGEHPFIVQLRYAFQTKDHLFLISDYCPGGDLSQYLEIEECFSEDKARLYIQEILLGIEALHKQNIIFRDLKPDNVIIDKKGHAMLTDFGLSRENVRRPTTGAKSFCGSYAYLAPEMLDKKGHGKAVDWYLLGVILFEMVTGLPPYYADDKDQLFKNIMRDTIDMDEIQSKQKLSNECIDIMQRLLMKDPAQRIGTVKGAIEIRSHPFFKKTDWDTVLTKAIPMPEPYLANMAMDIIVSQPYLVAGHPHTTGEICPRQHRSYLPGWSFTQAGHNNLTESQVSASEKLNLNAVKERANQQQQLDRNEETYDNQDLVVRDETQIVDQEGAT